MIAVITWLRRVAKEMSESAGRARELVQDKELTKKTRDLEGTRAVFRNH